MEALFIKKTKDTPRVVLDQEKNSFQIVGFSLPEDVNTFYQPVIDWLKQYAQNPNKTTDFIINLSYFNTASSKKLFDLIALLEDIHQSGNPVKIQWLCTADDEDVVEAGEEFKDTFDLPFEIIKNS